MVPVQVASCSKCGSEDNIGWDVVRDKPKRICRPCNAEIQRVWRAKNVDRVRRSVVLAKWAKFGLTEEMYDAMFEAQQHRCAICKCERRDYRALAVDHDHRTGKIRGLLCQDCNLALGQLKDDPELLDRAAAYLRAAGVGGP